MIDCLDAKRLFGVAYNDQNFRKLDRYVPFKLVDVGNRPVIEVNHHGKVIFNNA
jgi:hypothetical protein